MAYFANTYKTWFQDETLVFPEHQKISKSIKNPLRKLEKCETFSKNPMMMTICVDLYWYSFVFTMQINIFLPKYTFQMKIWANASHFFQFSQCFFYRFSKFLMFWKEESLVLKSSCISIYEIWRQVRVLSGSLFFAYSVQI